MIDMTTTAPRSDTPSLTGSFNLRPGYNSSPMCTSASESKTSPKASPKIWRLLVFSWPSAFIKLPVRFVPRNTGYANLWPWKDGGNESFPKRFLIFRRPGARHWALRGPGNVKLRVETHHIHHIYHHLNHQSCHHLLSIHSLNIAQATVG